MSPACPSPRGTGRWAVAFHPNLTLASPRFLWENGVVFSDSFVLAEVAALGHFGFSVRSPFPRQEPSMTAGQEMPQNSHPYGAYFQNFLPFLVHFHSFHFLYSSWNCDENYSDFIG